MIHKCQQEDCTELSFTHVGFTDPYTGHDYLVEMCEEHADEHYEALEQDLRIEQERNGDA